MTNKHQGQREQEKIPARSHSRPRSEQVSHLLGVRVLTRSHSSAPRLMYRFCSTDMSCHGADTAETEEQNISTLPLLIHLLVPPMSFRSLHRKFTKPWKDNVLKVLDTGIPIHLFRGAESLSNLRFHLLLQDA